MKPVLNRSLLTSALKPVRQVVKGQPASPQSQGHILSRQVLAGCAMALSLTSVQSQTFSLTSPDLPAGQAIGQSFAFNGFGCTGQNISPGLTWANPPAGTKSFAVMVHDPDAVTGGAGFWHWVVVDLPPNARGISRGAGKVESQEFPEGTRQIASDFGVPAWGGPCPPAGDQAHRYDFTVYALKVGKLGVPQGATASLTGFLVNANALGKASFTSTYGR
jgi:Raf kinase inhibitor-like YbhB/YbcL family protein